MSAPSPGLYAAVLHALRSADPREQSSAETIAPLVTELTSDEAAALPEAFVGVLPLLRTDLERTRFALELISVLDLWETARDVARYALAHGDPDLLLSAANICATAKVGGEVGDQILTALAGKADLARAAEIRMRPDAKPTTALEKSLFLQRWPGFRGPNDVMRLAPVVVLDRKLDAARMLSLAVELLRAGAIVRRLPEGDMPEWFGPQTVVVCSASTRPRILSRVPNFPEAQILTDPRLDTDQELAALLRKINSVLPSSNNLRLQQLRTELAVSLLDPDVFGLGVYETREASYLTTAPTSSIYRLAKNGLLEPRHAGVQVYSFRDLVALRTWRYLNAQSQKRISSEILPRLARFPGDPNAVRLGATSDGQVLVDRGQGWEDVITGARVMDLPVEDVDSAFHPFSIGAHRAPDLLQASENTRLHPAILHGSPYRAGHRITAKALAAVDRRGGRGAVNAAYPELADEDIADTVAIGRQLLAAA